MAMFTARGARTLGWTVAAVAVVALGALLLLPGADAQFPNTDIGSLASPLKHIWIGQDLGCQVEYVSQTSYQFYPPSTSGPADCGTFLLVGNTLFSPCFTAVAGCPTSHGGATGSIGAHSALTLEECPARIQAIRDAAAAVRPEVLVLC
ncbi:MAG: hypothetical protein ABR562_08800, partial [Thermoplasmatota archaeon]